MQPLKKSPVLFNRKQKTINNKQFYKVMKTIKHLFFYLAFATLFATTGCIDDFIIRGNGIEATEGRIVGEFTKLKSSGSFDVHITKGDEYEVVVNAESNIIPHIETYVRGNTLEIDIRGLHNVNNRLPMEVFVTTPFIESIKQSGSGIITTDYFTAENFEIYISGSGKISTAINANNVSAGISGSGVLDISGEASMANYSISGSGKIKSDNLVMNDCYAKISGSGDMYIYASDFIEARISGSGNIYYYGNPDIETHISGSGKLIKIN